MKRFFYQFLVFLIISSSCAEYQEPLTLPSIANHNPKIDKNRVIPDPFSSNSFLVKTGMGCRGKTFTVATITDKDKTDTIAYQWILGGTTIKQNIIKPSGRTQGATSMTLSKDIIDDITDRNDAINPSSNILFKFIVYDEDFDLSSGENSSDSVHWFVSFSDDPC